MGNHEVPATKNPAWGFYGTIRHHADSDQAWPIAIEAVGEATGCAAATVRDFLDSRHGRHFADDVAYGLADGLPLPVAIEAAVDRWMEWRIGRRMARETGIPRGLPYLTGFAMACEVEAEMMSD